MWLLRPRKLPTFASNIDRAMILYLLASSLSLNYPSLPLIFTCFLFSSYSPPPRLFTNLCLLPLPRYLSLPFSAFSSYSLRYSLRTLPWSDLVWFVQYLWKYIFVSQHVICFLFFIPSLLIFWIIESIESIQFLL